MIWNGKEEVCERCGSPEHITGLGSCPAWGKWWPSCCYCWEKGVDVREHGVYYGCHKCLEKYDKFVLVPKLSSRPEIRKATPITTGVLDYFPLAIAEIARVSKAGNDQHNPGQPLHWAREKSTDHADCLVRHLLERGTLDTDGQRHSGKVAWRALALLQVELELSNLRLYD